MSVPPRPPAWEERLSLRFFLTFSPRLPRVSQPHPPPTLAPFERLTISRGEGGGILDATWYPAPPEPRGLVLFLHPWLEWGQAYFHRRGRIEAARAAGYHALTLDLPGFGDSSPAAGFFDLDIEVVLGFTEKRFPGLPHHLWGVSSGGYWAHLLLSRRAGVAGAFFEDVSPHLLEWSTRMVPGGRPAYALFRRLFPRAYRFLDLRQHAPFLHRGAVAYLSGELDQGVRPEDTRELARLARGECWIVPEADHLEAIKIQGQEVKELALRTFQQGERAGREGSSQTPEA